MNPIKDLLLAVDFSDHSNITFQSTIDFCKESNSTLSLIHVIPVDVNNESYSKACSEKIDKMVMRLLKENITVPHIKVISGNIDDQVVMFAESINANAIVIGSGNYHLKKNRLGGHAEAILRHSVLPVLIIKKSFIPKGKIACPIDLSSYSEKVLITAIEYAKHIGWEIVVIHAIEPSIFGNPSVGFEYECVGSNLFKDEEEVLHNFLMKFDFQGVTWTEKILLGPPAYELSEFIKKNPFAMTIMCSASRTGISRLILGSVAETITRNIDSPCLILKRSNK